MVRRNQIDFTSGPLLKKLILYTLPIVGVNILQLLFNVADVAILGIFTTDQAVAAAGSNSSIINLLVGFFVGLSVASNMLVARCVGDKNQEKAGRLVGTSIIASVLFGLILLSVGVLMAEQILIWTNCDPLVLPYATKYLRIYFLGMPIIMLYNFCAAILRAVGDTLRPLIFLVVGGVANIVLNIFFVTVVGLDVEGVAIATVASNLISAVCAIVVMVKHTGYAKLHKKHLRIYKAELLEIFRIGLPIGLTKCLFSVSNVLIQSAINAQGDLAMAANSIAHQYDMIVSEAMTAFSLAEIAIISQNLGAKNAPRIKKTIFLTLSVVLIIGIIVGAIIILLGRILCAIMTDTELVIEYAMVRIVFMSGSLFIAGVLNVIQEGIRALGYSFVSLVLSFVTQILFRIIYLKWIYPSLIIDGDIVYNLKLVYLIYPVSWLTCILFGTFILIYVYRRVKARIAAEKIIERKNAE